MEPILPYLPYQKKINKIYNNNNNNSNNENSINPCSMDSHNLPPLKISSVSKSCQTQNSSLDKVFKTLFGAELSEWPYSDHSLNKALELRISQENTKQEYYKVERMNRVIEIMKLAAISKVPGHLIPLLFDSKVSTPSSLSSSPSSYSQKTDSYPMTPPTSTTSTSAPSPLSSSPSPIRKSHSRGRTISNLSDLKYNVEKEYSAGNDNTLNNKTSNPMKNFKFGSGSAFKNTNNPLSPSLIQKKRTSLSPKHQLSPSRIGAHAISSLHRRGESKLSIDLSNLRHGSNHTRTLSLPLTVSIPETEPLNFHSNNKPTNNHKGNIFNEIIIPELPVKSHSNCRQDNTNDIPHNREEDQDVERLLDCSSQYIHKHRKKIVGSPLKEMIVMEESSENVTITEDDNDDSIVDFSISNTSGFCSSSPGKDDVMEPKTP